MRWRWSAVLIALAVAIGGVMVHGAIAEPPDPQAPTAAPRLLAQRRGGEGSFFRDLNLTPAQMQRMQAIRTQYQQPINQRRQALRQAQQELRQLLAGAASRSEVETKFRQVETLRQQVAELQFSSMLEMREVLTLEQRRKFAESMQNRRKQFKQRWQRSEPNLMN